LMMARKNYTLSLDTEVMEMARKHCDGMIPLSRFVQKAVEKEIDSRKGEKSCE